MRALLVDQQLGGRLERVLPDGEDGVLALLVLAQLRADARQQHGKLERLGDVVVGARIQAQDHVGIGSVARQHDDWAFERPSCA